MPLCLRAFVPLCLRAFVPVVFFRAFPAGLRYDSGVLGKRIISSIVMLIALLAVFSFDERIEGLHIAGTFWQWALFGHSSVPAGLLMWALFTSLMVLAAKELAHLFRAKDVKVQPWLIALGSGVACGFFFFLSAESSPRAALAFLYTELMCLFVAALVIHGKSKQGDGALNVASATVFASVYLALGPIFLLAIRQSYNPWVVAAVIVIVKICDVGAYFVGRAVGRHKLIVWLSPGKTWEGLLGGIGASALACVIMVALVRPDGSSGLIVGPTGSGDLAHLRACPLWYIALAGGVIGLVGQMGDLVVSFFKRDAEFKDSGDCIPGFGGLLDVLDSLILVAPMVYWFLEIAAIIT